MQSTAQPLGQVTRAQPSADMASPSRASLDAHAESLMGSRPRLLAPVKSKSTEGIDYQFHCTVSSGNLSLSCWQALVRKNSLLGRLKVLWNERGRRLVHPCKTFPCQSDL